MLIIGLYYICNFTLIKYHDIQSSFYSDFPSTYSNDSHMVCMCLCSGDKSCPTLWPHGLQHAKFLCPGDSPGKNTGVSCTMNKYRKGRERLLKIIIKKSCHILFLVSLNGNCSYTFHLGFLFTFKLSVYWGKRNLF